MPDLTITAFIAARLAEDEAVATAATRGEWRADPEDILVKDADSHWDGACVANASGADGAHIARHDPARALREIEAKRAIVAAVLSYEATIDGEWGHDAQAIADGLCPDHLPAEMPALRAIAAVWSGHGDYKPAWAPATA